MSADRLTLAGRIRTELLDLARVVERVTRLMLLDRRLFAYSLIR